MPRNRQQTEARIRAAALGLLQREGFAAWGVNAVARAASVDKVLLYRYFTSMDGLLGEIIALTPFWPDPDALPAHSPEAFFTATLAQLEQQPQAFVLLALPAARRPDSAIRRKFNGDLERWLAGLRARVIGQPPPGRLERWLAGLRARVIGQPPPGRLERVAALLHCCAATGLHRFSPAELWSELAPPLAWAGVPPAPQPETAALPAGELPTALL